MLARSDGTSADAILIMTSDPFRETIVLSPLFGRVATSGASASRIDFAIRGDFAEITISAAQFVEVNVIGA